MTHPLELLQRLRIEFTHTVHVYALKRECLQGHQPDTNNLGLSFCEDHPQLLDQKTQVKLRLKGPFIEEHFPPNGVLFQLPCLFWEGTKPANLKGSPKHSAQRGTFLNKTKKKGHAMLRPSREAALRPVCGVIEEKAEEA